jgi:hypothetical protein
MPDNETPYAPIPDDDIADLYIRIAKLKLERFNENLAYVTQWKQYEMLELVKQNVDICDVSIVWLQNFREDLDLKV